MINKRFEARRDKLRNGVLEDIYKSIRSYTKKQRDTEAYRKLKQIAMDQIYCFVSPIQLIPKWSSPSGESGLNRMGFNR
jgi:hypothetical protein